MAVAVRGLKEMVPVTIRIGINAWSIDWTTVAVLEDCHLKMNEHLASSSKFLALLPSILYGDTVGQGVNTPDVTTCVGRSIKINRAMEPQEWAMAGL